MPDITFSFLNRDGIEEVEDFHHHENCDKELHENEKLPANYKDQIERIMQIYASTLVSSKYFRSCSDGRKLEVLQHLFNLKEKIKKDEKPKSVMLKFCLILTKLFCSISNKIKVYLHILITSYDIF